MEGRTARELMVVEIGAGGRTSTGGDGELDWGARTLRIRMDTRVSLRREEEVKERG
jgi:hypothetical protein